jgi:glycosyltransferase 2 family protein
MNRSLADTTDVQGEPPRRASWLRRNAQILIGLGISALAVWQLVTTVEPDKLAGYMASADPILLTICFFSVTLSMILKTIRWRYLFPDGSAPPFRPMLSALYIGYLANTVLPARIGEFVRIFLVGRDPKVGVSTTLASVVLEKVLDLGTLVLILLGLIVFDWLPQLPDWIASGRNSSLAALLVGVVALGLMLRLRRQVIGLVVRLETGLPILTRLQASVLAASFLDGLAGLGRPRTLPYVVVWTVAIWASALLTIWLGMQAVGIRSPLASALLVIVVTNLGMAVPSSPGYVGVFHLLFVEALLPFNVAREQALSAATLVHALIFGNFIVVGSWLVWRGGHSLSGLRKDAGH